MFESKKTKLPSRKGLLFVALLITLFLPLMTQAAPTLTLAGDFTGGGELEIGGHLDASFAGVTPFEHYSILLVDESQQVVASLMNLQADAGGAISPRRLWTRTGVVGCDPGAVHDPLSYQFLSFLEADAILHGRVFEAQLIEGVNRSRVLATEDVDLRAVVEFIEGYPSDGAGCLRTRMHVSESLYLAIAHQGGALLPLQINLVDATALPAPGQAVIDVRGAPQVMNVPAGANPWVELMWLAPVAGDYQVIVRPVNSSGPFDPNIDLLIETGVKLVGATANQCGGICPP